MAKHILQSVMLVLFMACTDAKQTGTRIHIEDSGNRTGVTLITRDSTFQALPDSTGMVSFTLDENSGNCYANIIYDGYSIPVYMEKGQTSEVGIDCRGERMKTWFKDGGSEKNAFLNHPCFQELQTIDYQMSEKEFITELQTRERRMDSLLYSKEFGEEFSKIEKARIRSIIYSAMPTYALYHPIYCKEKTEISDTFCRIIGEKLIEDRALEGSEEYRNAMSGKINFMAGRRSDPDDPLDFTIHQTALAASRINSPWLREIFIDKSVTDYIIKEGIAHLDELEPTFRQHVRSAEKITAFEKICAAWQKIAIGQKSPDFNYEDIDGNKVSLEDLAGKYVFIDIWATWCRPCRGELPYLEKLEKYFEGRNIVFVSISCDQDKKAWKTMVKKEKLKGIQLHMGNNNSFMAAYMVKSIPRFILLDQEGRIISSSMSRPSDPETLVTLKSLKRI